MGQRFCAVDPAVAGARQIHKAEPDNDGAVARTIGAIPIGETETAGVSVAITFDGQSLMGIGGTAKGRWSILYLSCGTCCVQSLMSGNLVMSAVLKN